MSGDGGSEDAHHGGRQGRACRIGAVGDIGGVGHPAAAAVSHTLGFGHPDMQGCGAALFGCLRIEIRGAPVWQLELLQAVGMLVQQPPEVGRRPLSS